MKKKKFTFIVPKRSLIICIFYSNLIILSWTEVPPFTHFARHGMDINRKLQNFNEAHPDPDITYPDVSTAFFFRAYMQIDSYSKEMASKPDCS
jgi:hypothetical protein